MAERKKDDVGTTNEESDEGLRNEASGAGRNGVDNATAASKGTIGSGTEEADFTQASGGSVD
jgi:hypothetical protein